MKVKTMPLILSSRLKDLGVRLGEREGDINRRDLTASKKRKQKKLAVVCFDSCFIVTRFSLIFISMSLTVDSLTKITKERSLNSHC